ncbi:hypothetical protein GCM10009804_02140 [Kribbella hippodromi]|uniref:Uncharacterized protein n=1 Tax=Kribbella hippodromi TaxID=434347 RepID=A0ABN2BXH4_9ACTN
MAAVDQCGQLGADQIVRSGDRRHRTKSEAGDLAALKCPANASVVRPPSEKPVTNTPDRSDRPDSALSSRAASSWSAAAVVSDEPRWLRPLTGTGEAVGTEVAGSEMAVCAHFRGRPGPTARGGKPVGLAAEIEPVLSLHAHLGDTP